MHATTVSNLLVGLQLARFAPTLCIQTFCPMIHCEARTLVYLEIQTGHVLVDIPVLAQKLKLKTMCGSLM